MKCYFCQNELELDTTRPRHASPHYDAWKSCDHCTSTYGLHMVLTNSEYAHMYLDKQEFLHLGGASNIPGSSITIPTNAPYTVRLNLLDNTTDVYTYVYQPKNHLHLPGFPMKPANVREKLKLYLLFS